MKDGQAKFKVTQCKKSLVFQIRLKVNYDHVKPFWNISVKKKSALMTELDREQTRLGFRRIKK